MSIKLDYSAGPIARAWAGIYAAASHAPLPDVIATAPARAGGYLAQLYRGRPHKVASWIECAGRVADSGRALVLFSGGKDSLAAALRLKAAGIAPVLLFAQGINPAYPGEIEAAKRLAGLCGWPLHIVKVSVKRGAYIENPAKNQMLLAIAADLGARWGIARFSAGIMADDHIKKLDFAAGYSDAVEMHGAAAEWVEANLSGSIVERSPVKNDTDSLMEVINAGLLPSVRSCMATQRFCENLAKRNREKYRVELMPGRCGSCYKCALEWLHLSLMGAALNSEFSAHCVGVLEKASARISGKKTAGRAALEMFIDSSRVDIGPLLGCGIARDERGLSGLDGGRAVANL